MTPSNSCPRVFSVDMQQLYSYTSAMNESCPFDLVHTPLDGANLIEASAGTGKTYAITAIFLRLLLEQQLKVNQILVVTYTVAATEELRDRMRRQIRAAIVALESSVAGDEFIRELIGGLAHPEEGLRLLKTALTNFDEAPIYTIHSFCQQVLREHAFESLSLFDTELITDETTLVEEIVDDFWRRNFYGAAPEFIRYARNKKYSPEAFLKITRNSISQPDIRIQPEIQPLDLNSLAEFRDTRKKMKAVWDAARSEVTDKLRDPGLNKLAYKNPEFLISIMEEWLNSEGAFPPFPACEKFTPGVLTKKTNKNRQTPEHPFFDLCGALWNVSQALAKEMDHQLLYFKTEIFRILRRELPLKKEQQNIQSYDDLLIRVRTALEKPGGETLVQALRQRYRAALIDEFQDTDPVQYAIFQTVFGKGCILFLIGDPKQAIYSFRSADLFSYLRASRQVQNRYTLTRNWRSEPHLVEAINHLFAAPGQLNHDPFVFAEIPLHASSGVDDRDRPLLKLADGADVPPFELVYIDEECLAGNKAAGNKENFRRLIAGAVAVEISRLLSLARQGKANVGAAPLQLGDMAVLVRENREARLVQKALHELAIPSVLHGAGNIFDAPEALEMERLLAGVADPRSEKALGAALLTDIMGVSGETMLSAKKEELPWEAWVNRFQQYNDLWEDAGFIRMFRTLLRNEDVHSRLLGYRNGERRLTNLLHLSEILHNEASARKLGMAGLIKWLARQRDPAATRLEEHELRLESDANAVRLVTIHKSKGLEYPIVFCPFQWGPSRTRKGELPRYHDDQDDWRLNLVLSDDHQQAVILAEQESLAENVRLLYVALTRAKYRAYLYWGHFKNAGSSSLAYILHPAPAVPAPPHDRLPTPHAEPETAPLSHPTSRNMVAQAEAHFSNLTEDQIRTDLETLAERSGGTIQLTPFAAWPGLPYEGPPEKDVPFAGRTFTGQIPRTERIASFSYFVARRDDELDNADRDQAPTAAKSLSAGNFAPNAPAPGSMSAMGNSETTGLASIFAFPAGTRAGIFIHDVLEALDFTDDRAIEAVVGKKLNEHGYDPHWQDTLCSMIRKVIAAPLSPSVPGLQLSAISPACCLRELGFYFPLQPVTPEKLGRIFSGQGVPKHYPRQMERLNFMPAQGFMNGYMDLVFRFAERFYLVDWKSNLLGTSSEDYDQEALKRVMERDYYFLQYHLYVLALDQYLKSRMGDAYNYERHFGGVFYLFLRGVDPERGGNLGIYRERPARETIAALSRELIKTC